MAGYIAEFFGYNASDNSDIALKTAARKNCPFLGNFCVKTLARDKVISGVCAIRQKTPGSPNVICCPIRLYADNYKMLHEISVKAFRMKINLIAYDSITRPEDGEITPLGIVEEHCTTVYKVQEAFSSLNLPEGNVYKEAISRTLYLERYSD